MEDSEENLNRALCLFKCSKDHDIEAFLYEKAIKFNDEDICRTYVIVDEEQFNAGRILVVAYFTLSHRSIVFSGEEISKSKIKKITGFKDRKSYEFVLIGQLGKADNTDIHLAEILNYAYEVIHSADNLIPCNFVLIECSEELHNNGLYSKHGYKYLQRDEDLYQYYKLL